MDANNIHDFVVEIWLSFYFFSFVIQLVQYDQVTVLFSYEHVCVLFEGEDGNKADSVFISG